MDKNSDWRIKMNFEPLNFDYEIVNGKYVNSIIGRGSLLKKNKVIICDEIVIIVEDNTIKLSVDNNTDEIIIVAIKKEELDLNHNEWQSIDEIYELEDKILGWCWVGKNYLGYSDLFIISFNGIEPDLIFYGMGSQLHICRIDRG